MLAIDELRKGLRIRYDFSGVHAVVVEPPLTSRRVLRQAMLAIGMPAPREFEDATPRPADLMADTADVLFISASDEDPGPLRLVADIRARKIASNPFLPIVVTAYEPTPRLMRMASDAGADTIVAKPVSYKLIAERMESLVDARRPFIVTANYMGPDRRKDLRGGGIAIPGLAVPNTLAMRVHGQPMGDLDLNKIDDLKSLITEIPKAEEEAGGDGHDHHGMGGGMGGMGGMGMGGMGGMGGMPGMM
jgi:CheY-like chemotaxis protein